MLCKPVMGGITSHYGWRTLRDRYGREYRNFHNGTDFGWLNADVAGSRKVYSAHPGIVVDAAYSSEPGNYVLVDIGGGKKLRYIHLDSFAVKVGQKVGYSTFIGVMGDTGTATSPGQIHLHLDLYKGSERVNLEPFLTLPFGHTGPSLAGGASPIPIESEEDDMAHFDLIKTPDGTVWWCVNRATRYAIPNGDALTTYQAFARELTGSELPIRAKTHAQILAYGAPVYASPVVASNDTPAILAALDALPAKIRADIKNAL